MRASQLAKQHGHKLAPTGEAPRVPLGLVLLDRLFEIPARKKLQHLRKNAAYFVHRLSLLRLYWFFRNPIQPIRGSAFHSHSRFPGPPRGITQLFWTAMIGDKQTAVPIRSHSVGKVQASTGGCAVIAAKVGRTITGHAGDSVAGAYPADAGIE